MSDSTNVHSHFYKSLQYGDDEYCTALAGFKPLDDTIAMTNQTLATLAEYA